MTEDMLAPAPIEPLGKMVVLKPWVPPDKIGALYVPQGVDEGAVNAMSMDVITKMGFVVAVGAEVSKVAVGDEVYTTGCWPCFIDGGNTRPADCRSITHEDNVLAIIHRGADAPAFRLAGGDADAPCPNLLNP